MAAPQALEALNIAQEIGSPALEGFHLNNIGLVYIDQEEYEQAEKHFKQAQAIWEEVDDPREQASTFANIGLLHLSQGEIESAHQNFEQALRISQEIGNRLAEGTTLERIGRTYEEQEQYEEALNSFGEAQTIFNEIGESKAEGQTLNHMGRMHHRLGQHEEALEHYEQAIQLLEEVRGEITVDEFKSSFTSEQVDVYHGIIDLLIELERPEEAFDYVQRAKGRTFLDQLGNGQLNIRTGVEGELLAREQELQATISARRAQLVRLNNAEQNSPTEQSSKTIEQDLTELEQRYQELLLEIKAQSPELASLVTVDVSTLAEIQAQLDSNSTLVEYFVTDEQILMFVISRESFELITTDVGREALTAEVGRLGSLTRKQKELKTASLKLYEWLIAPIADSLSTQ